MHVYSIRKRIAQRKTGLVVEKAIALHIGSNAPKFLWEEVVLTTNHLIKRVPLMRDFNKS